MPRKRRTVGRPSVETNDIISHRWIDLTEGVDDLISDRVGIISFSISSVVSSYLIITSSRLLFIHSVDI